MTDVKSSSELKDVAPGHYDKLIRITEEYHKFSETLESHNSVILVNRAFSAQSIAMVHFDDDMQIDVSSGAPEIDWEALDLLTPAEKLKFIQQMAKSIMGTTDALDRLAKGFYSLLVELEDVERNMLGKDRGETKQ